MTREQTQACLAKAAAQIERGTAGFHPQVAEMLARTDPRRPVDGGVRLRNLLKLSVWVGAKRQFAATKADPDAYLLGWSAWLAGQMTQLGGCVTPKHLLGLTAIDLANAQAELAKGLSHTATALTKSIAEVSR